MVDINNMPAIGRLMSERRTVEQALRNFDQGGKITELTISPADNGGTFEVPATINTASMAYPQQMADAIKSSLQQRLTQIEQELGSLGLTGVAETRGMTMQQLQERRQAARQAAGQGGRPGQQQPQQPQQPPQQTPPVQRRPR